ncbi:MAG: phenylalanine--tRNA ligase subunit alpha [Pseudomonadota bacterium]
MDQLEPITQAALAAAADADSVAAIDAVRVRFLGKKGELTALLKQLGQLSAESRPAAGQRINAAKAQVETALVERKRALESQALEVRLKSETLDMTQPGRGSALGTLHPVTKARRRIEAIFRGAGFAVRHGPEIEDDFHNFTALNIPEDHPARAMHDTFYFGDGRLLRTHTSPTQIRSIREEGVPIKVICPGRVYRCDSDQTHTPMFNQVEGLVIDRHISFANLKSVLYEFVGLFFEREAELRFRPSYFPFTEPSAEVDVRMDNGSWLEILGCGMVHPNVLEHVGVDPNEFGGYAFGIGIERLAMLRYGIRDLRTLFENDVRFLEQFG